MSSVQKTAPRSSTTYNRRSGAGKPAHISARPTRPEAIGKPLVASADEENMGKAVDVTLERIKVQLKKANDKQNDHRAQPVSEVV